MRNLIADDDSFFRFLLAESLLENRHEVISCENGTRALEILSAPDRPEMAILDWIMPGPTGPEICEAIRRIRMDVPTYLILLTSNKEVDQVAFGLDAGANDYITKPFFPRELNARIGVGERMISLQKRLADRNRELQEALDRVSKLQKLLPICAYCKKIRDDQNFWTQVEDYLCEYANVKLTHGICPDCLVKAFADIPN